MRWTIWVDGDDVYTKALPGWKKIEVVPASFTDEALRVAERWAKRRDIDSAVSDAFDGIARLLRGEDV